MATVLIYRADEFLREVPIIKDEVVIGRGERADVPLDDRHVSRCHARLVHRPGGTVVFILEASSGARRGGRDLAPGDPVPLADGDEVEIGPFRLKFRLRGAALGDEVVAEAVARRILGVSASEMDILRVRLDLARVETDEGSAYRLADLVRAAGTLGPDRPAALLQAWNDQCAREREQAKDGVRKEAEKRDERPRGAKHKKAGRTRRLEPEEALRTLAGAPPADADALLMDAAAGGDAPEPFSVAPKEATLDFVECDDEAPVQYDLGAAAETEAPACAPPPPARMPAPTPAALTDTGAFFAMPPQAPGAPPAQVAYAPPKSRAASPLGAAAAAAGAALGAPVAVAGKVLQAARARMEEKAEERRMTKAGGLVYAKPEGEMLQRMATCRYYTQMNPFKTFPLIVVLSRRAIRQIQAAGVGQKASKERFAIKASNPFVTVVPSIGGCLITPSQATVDVRPEIVDTRFSVTPLAEGEFPEAVVEIHYEGKVVDRIEIPTRVVTQTATKIGAVLTGVVPLVSSYLKMTPLQTEMQAGATDFFQRTLAWLATSPSGGWALASILLAGTVVLYLARRPRESSVEKTFFEVEDYG